MMDEWLGPLMFVAAFGLIFSGYPVAFALGGTSLVFAGIGIALGYFEWAFLYAVLLAVPFFIFMGTLLERSKLAEDLLRTVGLLFGPLRGGLALAVVVVGTMLAAATGVVGASVVAMGMISLPVMMRYGYDGRFATGVIAASGTLGQLVPPSVVLVVLGDQLGVSVGDLFRGALVPGLMLSSMFAVYVLSVAWMRPELAPAIPAEERQQAAGHLAVQVLKVLLPPLVLILVVLGSIFSGLATPTEAGALGSVGAALLALAGRRLNLECLRSTMTETLRLTTMVVFLLIGSTAFALVFRGVYGDVWIEDLLTNLPGGVVGLLVIANLAVFLLGFFIDFFEIAFILLPLIAP
ncbi:MAG: TRAP transporter large permease, partial [Planctomycetota bacterium]